MEGVKRSYRVKTFRENLFHRITCCATVNQAADLGKTHLRWLANYMGHNIDVHCYYYRLKESTVELTNVARLLCVIAEKSTANIQGKKL